MGQERRESRVEKEDGRPSPIHMPPSRALVYRVEVLGLVEAMEAWEALPDHHSPRSRPRMIDMEATTVPETDGPHTLRIVHQAMADHRRGQERSKSNTVPDARRNLVINHPRLAGTAHLRCPPHHLRNAGRLQEKEIEDMAKHVAGNAMMVCDHPKSDTNNPHQSRARLERRRMDILQPRA